MPLPVHRFDRKAQVAPIILFIVIFALIGFVWIMLGPMMDVGASTFNSYGDTGGIQSEESRQTTSVLQLAFENYPIIALLILLVSLFITAMREKYSTV